MFSILHKRVNLLIRHNVRTISGRTKIGNRDVVGFGHNGTYMYQDNIQCIFPAIRFKENTPDIVVGYITFLKSRLVF